MALNPLCQFLGPGMRREVTRSVGSPASPRLRSSTLRAPALVAEVVGRVCPAMCLTSRLHHRVELECGVEQLLLVCSDGVWEFITAQEVPFLTATSGMLQLPDWSVFQSARWKAHVQ